MPGARSAGTENANKTGDFRSVASRDRGLLRFWGQSAALGAPTKCLPGTGHRYAPIMAPVIRPIEPRDLPEIQAELETHWHSTQIWSLGRMHQADALPGFVAEVNGAFAGLVTMHMDPGGWQCEVITLSSRVPTGGVGAALLAAAERHARAAGCRRIFLTTTNDNTHAMRFYQRQGWCFCTLHKGIVDRVRTVITDLPLLGFHGIQVRDEIEFERWLADSAN